MKKLLTIGAAAVLLIPLALLSADYPSADSDIYGNAIYTNETGAVTYRFLVSGDVQDNLSTSNTARHVSNEDVALDAVFKSVWSSAGGWLYATMPGALLIVW